MYYRETDVEDPGDEGDQSGDDGEDDYDGHKTVVVVMDDQFKGPPICAQSVLEVASVFAFAADVRPEFQGRRSVL